MDTTTTPPPAELPALGIFADLDAALRAKLAAAGDFESFPPGTYLVTQGQPNHHLMFVISGKLKVYIRNHADTIQLPSILPGETAGEMNIIDPHKASADVVVGSQPAEVFTLSQEEFESLVKSDPAAGYAILHALARELCHRLRVNSETLLQQAQSTREHFQEEDY